MTHEHDLGALARSIIDSNRYMTLGTADESGRPWVSPVWYAPAEYREFFSVSSPDAKHSRNLARRPQLAIVIFDSHRAGGWNALYMSAVAEELVDVDEGNRCLLAQVGSAGNASLGARRGAGTRPPSPVPRHRLRALRARPHTTSGCP
jgi:Pyridoxamine 5'-phosphate oxidase